MLFTKKRIPVNGNNNDDLKLIIDELIKEVIELKEENSLLRYNLNVFEQTAIAINKENTEYLQ